MLEMRNLYIHLGMPKCGTSALQVFFAKMSSSLKAHGIDYLELGNTDQAKLGAITSGNGGPLARSMLAESHEAKTNDYDRQLSFLEHSVNSSDSKDLLISSEFFAMVPRPALESFYNYFYEKNIRLKVVFYLRRQDQSLMSGYMQRVKRHGHVGYPEDYVKEKYRKAPLLNYYNYTRSIENIVGKGNVIPLNYENSKRHPKGIVGDFWENVFGAVPDWLEKEKVVNVSPSPQEIKLLLLANKFSPRNNFSDFIVEDSVVSGRSGSHSEHSLLSNELVVELLDYFKNQNLKLKNEYGISFTPYQEREFVDLEKIPLSLESAVISLLGLIVRQDKLINQN